MRGASYLLRSSRLWAIPFLLASLAVMANPLAGRAADLKRDADAFPVQEATGAALDHSSSSGPSMILVAGLNFSRLYAPIESLLNNPKRMLQVCVVGACLALYIMMRARG